MSPGKIVYLKVACPILLLTYLFPYGEENTIGMA